MSRSAWKRVSKRRKCLVCGKPDWCLYIGPDDNPEAAICARIESPKRCGESGWLHRLRDDGPAWTPTRRLIHLAAQGRVDGQPIDFNKLADDCQRALKPEALERLAQSLGLSVHSLTRLGIGWASQHRAWTFPMRDTHGDVVGIRLRSPGGKKLSVRGGHEGVFIPEGLGAHGLLLITEGPTDTAAMLDLGYSAVGRPSCTGGVKMLVDLVRQRKPVQVVIVADGDAPGQRGAENLASVLVAYCAAVQIITPPLGIKDARAWKQAGASAADVQAVIDAAPVRRLKMTVRKAGGRNGR